MSLFRPNIHLISKKVGGSGALQFQMEKESKKKKEEFK